VCDEGESILRTLSLDPEIENLLQEIEIEKSKARRLNQLINEKLETFSTSQQTHIESMDEVSFEKMEPSLNFVERSNSSTFINKSDTNANEEKRIDISGLSEKESRKRKPIEVKSLKNKRKQRKLNSS
jgi:hypothetical protein